MRLPNDICIVFDLDGTLVDTAPDLVHTLNHVLTGIGCPQVSMAAIRPMISFGARRMLKEGLHAAGREPTGAELDLLLAEFLEHYDANIAVESRPFPGAPAALKRLKAAGARLGICTNKHAAVSRKLLTALNMDHFFAAIVGRDTLPVSKPHPGHLTGTIARMGGAPERSVMVGDSGADVQAAKAAGIPVVAVTFGYSEAPVSAYKPDRLIDHFDELETAIAEILVPAP